MMNMRLKTRFLSIESKSIFAQVVFGSIITLFYAFCLQTGIVFFITGDFGKDAIYFFYGSLLGQLMIYFSVLIMGWLTFYAIDKCNVDDKQLKRRFLQIFLFTVLTIIATQLYFALFRPENSAGSIALLTGFTVFCMGYFVQRMLSMIKLV